MTLFGSKSSVGEERKKNHDEGADEEALASDVVVPRSTSESYPARRRRSSLSALDVLKRKDATGALLASGSDGGGPHHGVSKLFPGVHSHWHLIDTGGSIGDLMNLKHFGSNRSLGDSMTSCIAESVPLETVHRCKKMMHACSNDSGSSHEPGIRSMTLMDVTDAGIDLGQHQQSSSKGNYDESLDQARHLQLHRRTLSVIERADRLSQLIQNRQSHYRRDITMAVIFPWRSTLIKWIGKKRRFIAYSRNLVGPSTQQRGIDQHFNLGNKPSRATCEAKVEIEISG